MFSVGVRVGAADEAQLMRALHDQHARAVWAYVVRLTNGDAARADDVVQETLLRAWRNPQVLDQSRGSPRSWLFTAGGPSLRNGGYVYQLAGILPVKPRTSNEESDFSNLAFFF